MIDLNINEITENLLKSAETQFGPMCSEWYFSGVEFNDGL